MMNKNKKQVKQDSIEIGRLLNFSIKVGLKKATNKLTQPAPRFAHLASISLNPIEVKILTE
jgi:hypothetical protein